MAKRDALLRLNRTLLARRADLCKTLADELANLRELETTDSIGDSADRWHLKPSFPNNERERW